MNTDALWGNFLNQIKEQISSLAYETWFKDTKLAKLEKNNATIVVPLNLHKKHLQENYDNVISTTFNNLTGTNFNFTYLSEDEVKQEVVVKEVDIGVPHVSSSDANLSANYTFASFMVGTSNKFAYTAAMSVAEKPGKAYNPLFLYGKSGLGKTHLMHAIGNYIIENSNQKVLYVTSDMFVTDFISTVRSKEKDNYELIESFKKKYRNVDVLLIDDIQFLEGAIQSQQEFFHTFNELYTSNKQIIIASDRSVDDLKLLEERLRTRFSWGLTANLFPPDFDLRVSIINRKIIHQEGADDVPQEVIEYIANNFDSDIRQLEGAITRVFAFALMMNSGKMTLDVAVDALKDQLTSKVMFKNDIARIQKVVAEYFHVSVDDLKGKKRNKTITVPRQVAIYYCRILTNESFPRIASNFGGRDHSTIMHSYEKIKKESKTNEQIKFILKDLKKNLGC
ncbi:MAG: chromosomal replication initiator protein DnaA [bacterium]|nr:chromosomal replication initiator protein DnaA [bacterium]